jgi:hypothetical protein
MCASTNPHRKVHPPSKQVSIKDRCRSENLGDSFNVRKFSTLKPIGFRFQGQRLLYGRNP